VPRASIPALGFASLPHDSPSGSFTGVCVASQSPTEFRKRGAVLAGNLMSTWVVVAKDGLKWA
jgi:hypothetical protein